MWKLMDDAITFSQRLRLAWFVLTANKFTKGEYTKKFEDEWCKWNGSSFSVFVNSGSSANLILLQAIKELYKLKRPKVLVPACTWITNISPIIQSGMIPVFCDINFEDFSYDLKMLEEISKKIKIDIIFQTHLLGIPGSDKVKSLFPNALYISDCCESHGAKINGNKVGSDPDSLASTFSFYFGHHMTTVEGGMVTTRDYDLYKMLLLKRSHGLARELPKESFDYHANLHKDIDPKFLFLTHGYNVRNTDIGAFLGSMQLKNLDNSIKIRNDNYLYFHDEMFRINTFFRNKFYNRGKISNYSSFCLPLVFSKKSLKPLLETRLTYNEIEFRPIVSGNILKHPALNFYKKDCWNADLLHEGGLYVGNSQFVNKKMINKFLELIYEVVDLNA